MHGAQMFTIMINTSDKVTKTLTKQNMIEVYIFRTNLHSTKTNFRRQI
jgi:hypothetical protein